MDYSHIQKFQQLCREQGWRWHLGAWHHPHTTDQYITGNGFVVRVDRLGAYLLDLSDVQKGPEKYKKPEVKIPGYWESIIPVSKLSPCLQKWLEKPREVVPEKKKAKLCAMTSSTPTNPVPLPSSKGRRVMVKRF